MVDSIPSTSGAAAAQFLQVSGPYHSNHADIPIDVSPTPSRRSMKVFENIRKKSLSEWSLVLDIIRGGSRDSVDEQFRHPERVSASTGNLNKKGKKKILRFGTMSPNYIHKQLHIVQEEKAMQLAPSGPIDASKFVAYVTERRKKRILFKGEYLMIMRSVDPLRCECNVASTMGDRNQYPDTLPYDYNRVILSIKGNDENSHYINANYVESWFKEKAYVVTQSVKSKAASHEFWRMIWELGSNTIVMLTKVFDFMRVMCLQYWPITRFQFGEIDVETIETKTYAHFVIRTFRLKHVHDTTGQNARLVRHFHFTEWELNSFPYISAFIELRRRVRQWIEENPTETPIVVHCRDEFSAYTITGRTRLGHKNGTTRMRR
uniref:Tyrosine-protein phosphatase domain-containing protein n=1 Tax=Acrobeloides nanus TaxID=290746 RepID=A0A914DJ50_9BILA